MLPITLVSHSPESGMGHEMNDELNGSFLELDSRK